jgi:hypothetical protein
MKMNGEYDREEITYSPSELVQNVILCDHFYCFTILQSIIMFMMMIRVLSR